MSTINIEGSYKLLKTVRFLVHPVQLLQSGEFIIFICHVCRRCDAGIDKTTPDPDRGRIERDTDGQPTGLLFDTAHDFIDPLLTPSVDEAALYISNAVELLLRHGVTSAHACEDGTWQSFCQLADQRRLPIRIFYSAFYDTLRDDASFPAAGSTHGEMLSCDRVKLFVDGALGADTAALSQPYCNSTSSCPNYGLLKLTLVKPRSQASRRDRPMGRVETRHPQL